MTVDVPQAATVLLASLELSLRQFATELCERLMSEFGATLYVKTIYIGADIDGEMVAALYPIAQHIEIALALNEDHPCGLLEDATHLTWPSLPVLITVDVSTDRALVVSLIDEAASRVVTAEHHVLRSPEFFRGRNRRLSHDPKVRRVEGDR